MPRSALVVALPIMSKRLVVEQRTDLDKLVIDMETNGTLDPEEAVAAATILLNSLKPLSICVMSASQRRRKRPEFDPILRPVDDLELRSSFCELPEGRSHPLHW